MSQIKEIKILRLATGEDIVSYCIIDDETYSVLLDNPMRIHISRSQQTRQTVLILMPWLPIELIEEDTTYIKTDDVVAFMDPKQSFQEYYLTMIETFSKLEIVDPLSNDNETDDEEDNDFETAYEEEELNKIKDILDSIQDKKIKYH